MANNTNKNFSNVVCIEVLSSSTEMQAYSSESSIPAPTSTMESNLSSRSISNDEKVANWIEMMSQTPEPPSLPPTPQPHAQSAELSNESDNPGLIIVRCDYEKSDQITPDDSTPEQLFLSQPLYTYVSNDKPKTLTNILNNTEDETTKSETPVSYDSYETPLSPNSQKKELCNYLKLMNPADQRKEILLFENRRSKRVRNLIIEAEKKIAKKRRTSEATDDSNPSSNQCKIILHRLTKSLIQSMKPKSQFNFCMPPAHVLDDIQHFDQAMQTLMNRPEARLELPQISPPKKGRKKKRKKTEIHKMSIRKSLNENLARQRRSSRKRALRSKIHLKNINIRKIMLRGRKNIRHSKINSKNNKETKEKSPEQSSLVWQVYKRNSTEGIYNDHCYLGNEQQDVRKEKEFTIEDLSSEIEAKPQELEDCWVELKDICEDKYNGSKIENVLNGKIEQQIYDKLGIEAATEIETNKESDKETSEDSKVQLPGEAACSESSRSDDSMSATQSSFTSSSSSIIDEENHFDHSYAHSVTGDELKEESVCEEYSTEGIEKNTCNLLPFNNNLEVPLKTLHRSLNYVRAARSLFIKNHPKSWDMEKKESKNEAHAILISKDKGGVVQKAFYVDCNLIISQEYLVSFWTQSPLGNILGAQNMWIPNGCIARIILNNKCVQKNSREMVISMETNVAYVELWTKEHKSDLRETPIADVFATIYFWKQRQTIGLEKKVIQLENIKGFVDDVQYVVVRNAPKIIVSWHSAQENKKSTFVHCYQLAADYQTVANIAEFQPVKHYVSSMHCIQDCDTLVMGCGENHTTLWNIEFGYIVATVQLQGIPNPLATIWAKSDRGFLFVIQQNLENELRLIAINGLNHSWKRLCSFKVPEGYKNLQGASIINGFLIGCYKHSILTWNVENSELLGEFEPSNVGRNIPCGENLIVIQNEKVVVRNAFQQFVFGNDF